MSSLPPLPLSLSTSPSFPFNRSHSCDTYSSFLTSLATHSHLLQPRPRKQKRFHSWSEGIHPSSSEPPPLTSLLPSSSTSLQLCPLPTSSISLNSLPPTLFTQSISINHHDSMQSLSDVRVSGVANSLSCSLGSRSELHEVDLKEQPLSIRISSPAHLLLNHTRSDSHIPNDGATSPQPLVSISSSLPHVLQLDVAVFPFEASHVHPNASRSGSEKERSEISVGSTDENRSPTSSLLPSSKVASQTRGVLKSPHVHDRLERRRKQLQRLNQRHNRQTQHRHPTSEQLQHAHSAQQQLQDAELAEEQAVESGEESERHPLSKSFLLDIASAPSTPHPHSKDSHLLMLADENTKEKTRNAAVTADSSPRRWYHKKRFLVPLITLLALSVSFLIAFLILYPSTPSITTNSVLLSNLTWLVDDNTTGSSADTGSGSIRANLTLSVSVTLRNSNKFGAFFDESLIRIAVARDRENQTAAEATATAIEAPALGIEQSEPLTTMPFPSGYIGSQSELNLLLVTDIKNVTLSGTAELLTLSRHLRVFASSNTGGHVSFIGLRIPYTVRTECSATCAIDLFTLKVNIKEQQCESYS